MITTSPGATCASPSARLVETVVLPAPPFGHSAMTTRPRSPPTPPIVAVEHAAAVGGGVEGPLDRARRSAGAMSGAITSRAPARSASCKRSFDGGAMISDADVGSRLVERRGEREGFVGGDIGAERHHFDAVAAELAHRVARVERACPRASSATARAARRRMRPGHVARSRCRRLRVPAGSCRPAPCPSATRSYACPGAVIRPRRIDPRRRRLEPNFGTARQRRFTRARRAAKQRLKLTRNTTSRARKALPSSSHCQPAKANERRPSSR